MLSLDRALRTAGKTFAQIGKVLLLSVLFFLGAFIILVSIQIFRQTFQGINTSSLLLSSLQIAELAIFLDIGTLFLLIPFKNNSFISRIIQLFIYPLEKLLRLSSYYLTGVTPYLVLVTLFLFFAFLWEGLIMFHALPPLNNTVSLYMVLTITSITFTYLGGKIAKLFIGLSKSSDDYSNLYHFLQPSFIRVLLYLLGAVSYLLAIFERFSGIKGFDWDFWVLYKEVIVEVLITYIAFDALRVAWQDYVQDNDNKNLTTIIRSVFYKNTK